MNSVSSKPFLKQIFFLDLKDYPNQKKLIKDLELLGAKQELFLNKNISFVVSDKVQLKPEFKSPSAPFSAAKSISPSPFRESPFNVLNSPASNSSYIDLRTPMETRKPMSRAMSVLQKSKEKFRGGSKDITEICKQWNIKIYPLRKVLSCIEKYKNKYYKDHFAKKKTEAPSANAQKIYSPFIKFEDVNRIYKPKYKTFKSWQIMTDSPLLKSVNTITKNFKQCGDVFASRFVLKETKPSNFSWSSRNESFRTETAASVSKPPGFNSISNSVSVCGSRAVKVEKENHSNCQKAKKDKQTRKGKRHYCEICNVHFTDTEAHYEKKTHVEYLNNSANYKEVEDIVFSLPGPEDFLANLLEEKEKEVFEDNVQCFDSPIIEIDSSTEEVSNAPVQKNKDDECKTEDYSLNVNDYVSASCSSPSATLSFLEQTETTTSRNQDFMPPTLMCYTALESVTNVFCSQNNLFKPTPITCDPYNMPLLNPYWKIPPMSVAKGNNEEFRSVTSLHCCPTEPSNYGTGVNISGEVNISSNIAQLLCRPTETSFCESGVNISGEANISSNIAQLLCRPTETSYYESGVNISGEANISGDVQAETIIASPNFVDEPNARYLNVSSWPDPYYQPFSNVYSMYSEMPLDLSLNYKNESHVNLGQDNNMDYSGNIVNATNIPDIDDSVIIVDDAKLSDDSTNIIDVVNLSPKDDLFKIGEVNNVDMANTIDASKMLEDNNSNKVIDVSNDDGSAQIIDIITISIGDSASALGEIKVSNDTIKAVDKITASIDDSAGTINLTNTSEDNSTKTDLESPKNDNSANIVEMTKYSNGNDLASIDNPKMLSNNFIGDIKNPKPINSVSFVSQVGGLNKEDNFDQATENYVSSETDSDSDVHIMVSNCLNEIDKSLEEDNVDASPVILFSENEVMKLDTSEVDSHAKGFDAPRIRVELFNDAGVNESSTKHAISGTKRKYFHIGNSDNHGLSIDETRQMLTAWNSCELSEKNVPSYFEEKGEKICNIERNASMLYEQGNSSKASLAEEGPFKELIKSIRASKIPKEISDSDDAYIILDEVVEDDDCSYSEDSFELKIVGKDFGFITANNTKETGTTGEDVFISDDNLSNTKEKIPFVKTSSSDAGRVNDDSDQKVSSTDITDNVSEKQEEEQSSNNVVYELMECALNFIERNTENVSDDSSNAEEHHKDSSDSEEAPSNPVELKVCKMEDYEMCSDADTIREIPRKKLQVVIHKMGEDDLKKYGIPFYDNSSSVKYESSLNGSSSVEGNTNEMLSSTNESNSSFEDSPPPPSLQSGFDFSVADAANMQSNQTVHVVYLNSLAPSNSRFLSGSGQMVSI